MAQVSFSLTTISHNRYIYLSHTYALPLFLTLITPPICHPSYLPLATSLINPTADVSPANIKGYKRCKATNPAKPQPDIIGHALSSLHQAYRHHQAHYQSLSSCRLPTKRKSSVTTNPTASTLSSYTFSLSVTKYSKSRRVRSSKVDEPSLPCTLKASRRPIQGSAVHTIIIPTSTTTTTTPSLIPFLIRTSSLHRLRTMRM